MASNQPQQQLFLERAAQEQVADFRRAALPNWFSVAPVAAAVMSVYGTAPYNYIGTNLCVMLALVYFFIGLAVVHSWTATQKRGLWILIAYYALLGFPYPWTMIVMLLLTMLLGLADPWIDFRRRFAGKKEARG